ncbi:MAG TPA: GDP-mannose 4,6-dehydratase [Dongiaceae bacterium]|jgi:GDPmannose 4,6-dehydratase
MAKTALITGVTGQDGAYLARLLLAKGYHVFGTERAQQPTERARLDWLGVAGDLTIVQLELTDSGQIQRVLDRVAPDEIYNLAAQSFVHASFEQPIYAGEVTGLAVARILEALRNSRAKARFYQASTSELFGNAKISPQDEETPFHPRSPYAIAKLYGHHITVNYREAHGLHTSCGILFNHESPLRPAQFITRKVTLAFARMAAGQSVTLQVGNLDAARDWGFAGDYVEGMWRMVQQPRGDDFVLATGVAHTVRQLIETAAACVDLAIEWRGSGSAAEGIERKSGRVLVKVDPAFYRPADITQTVGNPAKAARELGWRATLDFEKLIAMMIEADLARVAAGGPLA